jgi:heme-degrading monooxygenase HmoA
MYAVVRRYQGASQLFEELAQRQAEVAQLLRDVPGFVDYYLFRSGDGGASVTVCADRAGTQESTRRAAEWIRQNVPAAAGTPPEITEGEVLYRIQP